MLKLGHQWEMPGLIAGGRFSVNSFHSLESVRCNANEALACQKQTCRFKILLNILVLFCVDITVNDQHCKR